MLEARRDSATVVTMDHVSTSAMYIGDEAHVVHTVLIGLPPPLPTTFSAWKHDLGSVHPGVDRLTVQKGFGFPSGGGG